MYTLTTYQNLKELFPELNAQLFNSSHDYRKQVLAMIAKQECKLHDLNEQFMGEKHEATREEACVLGYN
jgi:DNA anti-recombination protein RmuC